MSVGSFEQAVLLGVLRLEDAAYGMAIRDEISECTGRRPSLGAVYSTLDRLVVKGFLTVSSGAGGTGRRGRPRKFFHLEAAGRRALENSLESLEKLLNGIPAELLARRLG